MKNTGERYIPMTGRSTGLEHLHRYAVASELVTGKKVLDIACGEGYGSYSLSKNAANVIGIDNDAESISHARNKYRNSNLEFKIGTCAKIPLEDESIDVVVSFETIEHISEKEQGIFMSEIKRVLKPSGLLILSSPDKNEYTEVLGNNNKYHIRELSKMELTTLSQQYFKNVKLYGQRIKYGSIIYPIDYTMGGGQMTNYNNVTEPVFLLIVASDAIINGPPSSIFEENIQESEESKYLRDEIADRDHQISEYIRITGQQNIQLAERERLLSGKESEIIKKDIQISEQESKIIKKDIQISEQVGNIIKKNAQITEKDKLIADREKQISLIYDSWSWEITSPLRFSYDFLIKTIKYFSHKNPKDQIHPIDSKGHKTVMPNIKPIAFYLPQYHPITLNSKHFGHGFTDWVNVKRAIPHFPGHHQPQLPIDSRFYDLRNIGVMRKQAELAKQYGIYGFCFHYYWFSGKKLLERPLLNWLKDKKNDFPFCLCWANENWAKLWDGGDKEVIMRQELADGDDEKFMNDILPFLKDKRYIMINNRPVLVIYRPHIFEKERAKLLFKNFRNIAARNGIPDLYLIASNAYGFHDDPRDWGLDALVQFPPHGLDGNLELAYQNSQKDKDFIGTIYRMDHYIENGPFLENNKYSTFMTIFPGWDNTARKAYTGANVFLVDPDLYKKWLVKTINHTKKHNQESEQFVFINAWNEWAEGAHLEPDNRYGFGYLKATRDALAECKDD